MKSLGDAVALLHEASVAHTFGAFDDAEAKRAEAHKIVKEWHDARTLFREDVDWLHPVDIIKLNRAAEPLLVARPEECDVDNWRSDVKSNLLAQFSNSPTGTPEEWAQRAFMQM